MNFTPLSTIPDVSVYQDVNSTPQRIDFVKMRSMTEGVIIRAGQNSWIDEDFSTYNWQAAKAAVLKRGAYWYYDSRVTPQIQADLWKAAIGNDIPEWGLWVDLEEGYGGAYAGEANWKKFCEAVRVQFPNVKIGIYTANWWWSKQTVLQADYWASYPLWLASFTSAQSAILPKPWITKGAVLWQYSSTGNGAEYGAESLYIDLNYTSQAFYDLFGGGATSPPPAGGTMLYGRVNTPALHIRTGPGAGYPDIGYLLLNDYVVAVENVGGWWHLKEAYRGSWTGVPVALANGTLINAATEQMWCKDAYIVVVAPPVVTPPPPPAVVTLESLTIEPAAGTVLTWLYSDKTVKKETL